MSASETPRTDAVTLDKSEYWRNPDESGSAYYVAYEDYEALRDHAREQERTLAALRAELANWTASYARLKTEYETACTRALELRSENERLLRDQEWADLGKDLGEILHKECQDGENAGEALVRILNERDVDANLIAARRYRVGVQALADFLTTIGYELKRIEGQP